MMAPTLYDKLRAQELPAAAIAALRDPAVAILLSLWCYVKVEPGEETFGEPETWEDLWRPERFKIDVSDVALLLGSTIEVASRAVARAIALRVVYPDGTIHESARELLERQAETWKAQVLGQPNIPDAPPPEPGG